MPKKVDEAAKAMIKKGLPKDHAWAIAHAKYKKGKKK